MTATGQILRYEVVKGDKIIGEMNVSRTFSGNHEEIELRSDVNYKLLMSFHIQYSLNEYFYNGILQNGKGHNSINGSIQKEYHIDKNPSGYRIFFSEIPTDLNYESIKYTVAKLYFIEPIDGQIIFSQHFGRYLEFEEVRNHEFRMVSPDGTNYYTFENGICTQVKVSRDFGTIYFKMKPESYAIVKNKVDTLRNK
ncbi:MAG: hypothetical protein JXQ90_17840 [Cyclobacteriaceae bacterium]